MNTKELLKPLIFSFLEHSITYNLERKVCTEYYFRFDFRLVKTITQRMNNMNIFIVPENCSIQWVKNKISYESPAFTKPKLLRKSLDEENITQLSQESKPELNTKWIPVLPGLISQRYVPINTHQFIILYVGYNIPILKFLQSVYKSVGIIMFHF